MTHTDNGNLGIFLWREASLHSLFASSKRVHSLCVSLTKKCTFTPFHKSVVNKIEQKRASDLGLNFYYSHSTPHSNNHSTACTLTKHTYLVLYNLSTLSLSVYPDYIKTCTCCLYGAVRNGFEAGKIPYEGHWKGWGVGPRNRNFFGTWNCYTSEASTIIYVYILNLESCLSRRTLCLSAIPVRIACRLCFSVLPSCRSSSLHIAPLCKLDAVTTRINIRASSVVALYSMSAISELTCKSGNTFI